MPVSGRSTEAFRLLSCDVLDDLLGLFQNLQLLFHCFLYKTLVGVTMVSNLMSRLINAADHIRIMLCHITRRKKCRLYLILVQ